MPQGLQAVERQLQASEAEGAEPDREVRQQVAVRIKGLGNGGPRFVQMAVFISRFPF